MRAALIDLRVHLIAKDDRRYSVYPMAHQFLGSERVGPGHGTAQMMFHVGHGRWVDREVDLAHFGRDYFLAGLRAEYEAHFDRQQRHM